LPCALTAAALVSCALLAPDRVAAATPPALSGMPEGRRELGDAFVEAWLSLRRDLDASASSGVHPALVSSWFAATPRPVLRELARVSSDEQVALAAAAQLCDGAQDPDRRLLAELGRRYADSPNSALVLSLRIVAGDGVASRAAEQLLASPEPSIALNGAIVLAAAHDGRGLAHLRRALERGDAISPWAARALGRFGTDADVTLLEGARKRGVDPRAVGVGLGGIAVRRVFPFHAQMLARRDPSGRRFETVGGLYDAWLTVIGAAVGGGARDLTGLVSHVDRVRTQASGDDGEVVQRELQALLDFWAEVEARIRATPPTIAWPARFEEAARWLTNRSVKTAAHPSELARRAAAAIAVLASARDALRYDRLSTPSRAVVTLAPGGGRTTDGNFATSWRGAPGAVLEIEIARGEAVERIWIASPCDGVPKASVREIRVRGRAAGVPWTISRRFDRASSYFEEIDLGGKRTGRLAVEIVEAALKVACVAELRAE
jgi:hypothetical protein